MNILHGERIIFFSKVSRPICEHIFYLSSKMQWNDHLGVMNTSLKWLNDDLNDIKITLMSYRLVLYIKQCTANRINKVLPTDRPIIAEISNKCQINAVHHSVSVIYMAWILHTNKIVTKWSLCTENMILIKIIFFPTHWMLQITLHLLLAFLY